MFTTDLLKKNSSIKENQIESHFPYTVITKFARIIYKH